MADVEAVVTVAQTKWQRLIPVSMEVAPDLVTIAPPPIPLGCICSYTWHPAGDGRAVRNSPLRSCPADHAAIDGAAAQ